MTDISTIASGQDAFLSQLLAEAHNEDTTGLGEADLRAMGEALWAWAISLSPGERATRLRALECANGKMPDNLVLETVGPDIPFLVDSLIGECAAQGIQVKTLLHPIVKRHDGHTISVIQIYLPALSNREQITLLDGVDQALGHVEASVRDFEAMRARMRLEADALKANAKIDVAERDEAVALLNWLADGHFVFLGVREYAFETAADGQFLSEEPRMIEGSNLGILRDEALNVLHRNAEPTVVGEEIRTFLDEPLPLIIAKSTLRSRVHRAAMSDYIGVKHYGADGVVSGEIRFLGLFTADAYNNLARHIPLIRRRVAKVIAASGAAAGGHSETGLYNVLENWPRDELFQTNAAILTPMALGALHLIAHPRTRLFVRKDRFGRFVSAIIYVLREAYDSDLRQRITSVLTAAFGGELISFHPRFDDSPLARVHFQIALKPSHPDPDVDDLERRIALLARRWDDAFRELLIQSKLDDETRDGAANFIGGFNGAYREAFRPEEALRDTREIAALSAEHPVRLRAYRSEGDGEATLSAKIYARGEALPLSDCVPVLENMGLFVNFETGYKVRPTAPPRPDAPGTYWVHHLTTRLGDGSTITLDKVGGAFQDAFAAVWMGKAENDGFNQLVFTAALTWREAALLRGLCAYRRQTGRDATRGVQIQALANHGGITRLLIDLFACLFDPDFGMGLEERQTKAEAIHQKIEIALSEVISLEHDQVLRRLANLILAIKRTNYYQPDQPTIAFKIASSQVQALPAPKPYREIYVSSPQVDGVHLRFGAVARGGLRWSDRRDDFRTEVLGLVKAQQVKNAVIVPVGSKGGFYPKQLPPRGTREDIREEGIAAYKLFIGALLSLTDNLIDGEVIAPRKVVVHDGEDPYLVVAADKGTATFSDIANEISVSLGFWLGDAFASGGSAGYDHKKMGITARGGWEAVKRHFREMGKDIQAEPFTVIGVGDMSGDVFGNGMLLSEQTRLCAAFNHLHIFIDPNPEDTQASWAERKRLFDLPRSSWADYDTALISKGGGVFDRTAKSITLSAEIKAWTGLSADAVTPDELLRAVLRAKAELLWFGGIGTYIKAESENHGDAGDRANDAIRLDASELNVAVIGEGANLGVTQGGRIDFAAAGGRINTDAIDNSAGVDSSDHEVNIKILLSEAMRRGSLPRGERNTLLASMTDDVARHVLAHNYAQTGALTLAEVTALEDHDALEGTMVWLERRGVLDRAVEGLPSSDTMAQRKASGAPLTRPELSVILAWSKITLFDDLVASDVPDAPTFLPVLENYFPSALARFGDEMQAHRLKREIIATVLANRLLDITGPAFLLRAREASGASNADVCQAFHFALNALDGEAHLSAIDALDNQIAAGAQTQLRQALSEALFHLTVALAGRGLSLDEVLMRYGTDLAILRDGLRAHVSPHMRGRLDRAVAGYQQAGVPKVLGEAATGFALLRYGPAIIDLAKQTGAEVSVAARAYFDIGAVARIDRLVSVAEASLARAPQWDRLATTRLISDLLALQAAAATTALSVNGETVKPWIMERKDTFDALYTTLHSLEVMRAWSFAKFALAADAVRSSLAP